MKPMRHLDPLTPCDWCGEEAHGTGREIRRRASGKATVYLAAVEFWCERCRESEWGGWKYVTLLCPRCEGDGRYKGGPCAVCGGKGTMAAAVKNRPATDGGTT